MLRRPLHGGVHFSSTPFTAPGFPRHVLGPTLLLSVRLPCPLSASWVLASLPSPFVSSRRPLTFLLLPQRLAPLPGSKPSLFRCCPFYPFLPVGLQPSIGDSRELRGIHPSVMRCCHPRFSSFLVLTSQPPLLLLPCCQGGLMRFLLSWTLRLPMMSCLCCWACFSLFSAGGSLGINGLSRCIRNTFLVVLHMI